MQIIVRDNNIDQALKALKKKMQREGIFREMKLRGAYEKPSEKRARERAEAGTDFQVEIIQQLLADGRFHQAGLQAWGLCWWRGWS